MTQDDRWNSDDDRAPYLDRPKPGRVQPAKCQPDRRGKVTPEEIAEFVKKEFGEDPPEKGAGAAGWTKVPGEQAKEPKR